MVLMATVGGAEAEPPRGAVSKGDSSRTKIQMLVSGLQWSPATRAATVAGGWWPGESPLDSDAHLNLLEEEWRI